MKDLMLVLVLTIVVGAISSLKTDSNLVQIKKMNTEKLYMSQN